MNTLRALLHRIIFSHRGDTLIRLVLSVARQYVALIVLGGRSHETPTTLRRIHCHAVDGGRIHVRIDNQKHHHALLSLSRTNNIHRSDASPDATDNTRVLRWRRTYETT